MQAPAGALAILKSMSSVAAAARAATREEVLALTAVQRIELAFALGEEDLRLFMAASGLDRASALRHVRAQRQRGRRPSGCAAEPPA